VISNKKNEADNITGVDNQYPDLDPDLVEMYQDIEKHINEPADDPVISKFTDNVDAQFLGNMLGRKEIIKWIARHNLKVILLPNNEIDVHFNMWLNRDWVNHLKEKFPQQIDGGLNNIKIFI